MRLSAAPRIRPPSPHRLLCGVGRSDGAVRDTLGSEPEGYKGQPRARAPALPHERDPHTESARGVALLTPQSPPHVGRSVYIRPSGIRHRLLYDHKAGGGGVDQGIRWAIRPSICASEAGWAAHASSQARGGA